MIKAITTNVIPPNVPSSRKGINDKNNINNINFADKYTNSVDKFILSK